MSQMIRVAHSPDTDDAFMFYALTKGRLSTGDYEFEHILKDIETLNKEALQGTYEVTAISFHAYPHILDRYALMTCGGSIGDGYGPIIVSSREMNISGLKGLEIAVPGSLTTARLALKLFMPEVKEKIMNFDEILPATKRGGVDAGLIIHEGQISYVREGVYKIVDLGEWWRKKTGLPLPLGGNVVRRDIPGMKEIARLIKESIVYSLSHEDEAVDYALSFRSGLDREEAKKFIRMYVNDFTVHLGERGKKAVEVLLREGYEAGVIGRKVEIDWIEV